MRIRTAAIAAVAIAVAGLCTAAPAAAASTSGIAISAIYFDSPGPDSGSNGSLNAEWVKIKNVTGHRKSLTGCTLRDASSHVYRFPTFRLGAHAVAYIHTGYGMNRPHQLYWRSSWYVWNNTGDRATLRNAGGGRVDRCSHTRSADPRANC
jgi:Lamin Tail Domain